MMRWYRIGVALLLPAAVAGVARADDDPKKWKDQKPVVVSQLHSDLEKSVQQGVQACAEADHEPAVETLAWAMANLPADTAKLLQEWQELQDQMLKLAGGTGFQNEQQQSKVLGKMLTAAPKLNARLSVRVHGADGFALMDHPASIAWLCEKGLKYKNWQVAKDVAWALGEIGGEEPVKWLSRLITQRGGNPVVKGMAADSLGVLKARAAVADLGTLIEREQHWQVRLLAARALTRIDDPKGILPLVAGMSKENGRMLHEFNAALEGLTGEKGYPDATFWERWLERNKTALEDGSFRKRDRRPDAAPAGGAQATSADFYGIPIVSKDLIFIIDVSGSMEQLVENADVVITGNKAGSDLNLGRTRLARAQSELIKAIRGLSPDTMFNVIIFSTAVQLMSPRMLEATDANKITMEQEIRKLKPDGGTNIFDSLERAFDITGVGESDRIYKAPVDTIYLLSDGAPTVGRIIDEERILQEIEYWNRYRQIAIHTVQIGNDFGGRGGMQMLRQFLGGVPGLETIKPLRARTPRTDTPPGRGAGFLERLALENNGTCVKK